MALIFWLKPAITLLIPRPEGPGKWVVDFFHHLKKLEMPIPKTS